MPVSRKRKQSKTDHSRQMYCIPKETPREVALIMRRIFIAMGRQHSTVQTTDQALHVRLPLGEN
jgi:hypothetical protein